ncbi:D(2) dopamine receptor-like [Physella acuta]|uniref:D(2) dopamine receptor-like n=1 Tax=Physella acuta TaxID=109671 RepID=UPI0027DC7EF7|nr:D(2) dopamine receptor-like [Physella acuta]
MNNTTTPSDPITPDPPGLDWQKIALGVVLYILVLVTFFGNLLVLLAVYKERALQTAFNFLIVNLAVTDMGVAATAMSFYATDMMLGYWPFGRVMCTIWIFCDYGMTFASVFSLVAISADRILMLCLWVPGLTLDRIHHIQPPGTCMWDPAENREFVVVIAIVGHHGPCFTMLFFYVGVFFCLKTRVKVKPITQNSKVWPAPQNNNEQLKFADAMESSAEFPATSATAHSSDVLLMPMVSAMVRVSRNLSKLMDVLLTHVLKL